MNREVEGLINLQTDLHGRISRSYENLRKTGSAKITLGVVEARLQALDANWAKFEAHNEKLHSTYRQAIAEHDYIRQDLPALAEESFLLQKGMFLDLFRSMKV